MNQTDMLQAFTQAANFVNNKIGKSHEGPKQVCRVTSSVAWADWEHKLFSPVFALYWQSQDAVKTGKARNLHLENDFGMVVSNRLQVTTAWLSSLVNFLMETFEPHTQATVDLTTGQVDFMVEHPVLVEEWTSEGISSYEVAQMLRQTYPAITTSPPRFGRDETERYQITEIISHLKVIRAKRTE